jgi:HKD family nuclease
LGIINQPYVNNIGRKLIDNLYQEDFNEFYLIAAYAKKSGVLRLLPYLESFRGRGGTITAIVGIDQFNTSIEALRHLKGVCNNLYIFHSESPTQTFHPKVYLFKNTNKAWFSIGSSNLTGGGLFSNYEVNYYKELQLNIPDQDEELRNISAIFTQYTDITNPCCKVVDDALIDELSASGYIKSELELQRTFIAGAHRTGTGARTGVGAERIFGKEKFGAPRIENQATAAQGGIATNRIEVHTPQQLQDLGNTVLMRHVPKAGDRSKQVHFNIDIKDHFFYLDFGTTIQLQEIMADGRSKLIEDRVLVFSESNRNVRIEVSGAERLDEHYPTNGNRPILLFRRISDTFFTYMLLLEDSQGYNSINQYLLTLPVGRSLPYKITDEAKLESLWQDCPLL